MTWGRALTRLGLLALIALLALRAFGVWDLGLGGGGGNADTATVTRVVDGDTVKVRLDGDEEAVRYIGVDTPESVKPGAPVECFAKAASDFNERLVEGRKVELTYDRERRDRYGRLLAYVRLAETPRTFVNAELVRLGYAQTMTIPPNTAHAAELARLAGQARRSNKGLWGTCGR